MSEYDHPAFSDDAPKENPWEDDRLGYLPFAKRLARAVLGLEAQNGYVIGMHGAWGSGKTTALNFLQKFLEKHNQELDGDARPLHVVLFSPWIVSGHQDLVAAFFKVLSEAIDDPAKRRMGWIKTFIRFWRRGVDPALTAITQLAATLPVLGGGAQVASAVAKGALERATTRWLEEPSMQAAYETLRKSIEKKGEHFLVLIDDLDRLEREEIRSIMQMVKTVGKLPHVVYLLAYDRSIVWDALDGGDVLPGAPRYAEKIIQQEIELPVPKQNALLSILDEELRFLTAESEETERWHTIAQYGITRWIRHARDVSRLANATKFSWPAIKGEIDPLDLMAMEGIRLFDTELFRWIRDNRAFLFDQGRHMMMSEEQQVAIGRALREQLPASNLEDQIEVLGALFPSKIKAIRANQFPLSGENIHETFARRGIGTRAGYDAYFSLFPPQDAVSKAIVETALSKLNDKAYLLATMRGFSGGKDGHAVLLASFLEELQHRLESTKRFDPTTALLEALFEIGPEVQSLDEHSGFFELSADYRVEALIRDILTAWGPDRAGESLEALFRPPQSATFCASVWVDRGRELRVLPHDDFQPATIITTARFEALGVPLLAMIEAEAQSGKLAEADAYFDSLRAWSHLAVPEPVRAWLAEGIEASPIFLAKVAKGLLAYSSGRGGRRNYVMRERPTAPYYDLDLLRAAVAQHVYAPNLSEDERARIDALREGLATLPVPEA